CSQRTRYRGGFQFSRLTSSYLFLTCNNRCRDRRQRMSLGRPKAGPAQHLLIFWKVISMAFGGRRQHDETETRRFRRRDAVGIGDEFRNRDAATVTKRSVDPSEKTHAIFHVEVVEKIRDQRHVIIGSKIHLESVP